MSSRDKASSRTSSRHTTTTTNNNNNNKPTQGRQSTSNASAGARNTTTNNATKTSSKRTTIDQKKATGKQGASNSPVASKVKSPSSSSSSSSSRNLQKFTKLQSSSSSGSNADDLVSSENKSSNLNEMATAKSFSISRKDEEEILQQESRFVEQETDVDEEMEKFIIETNENTGLLGISNSSLDKEEATNSDKQGDDLKKLIGNNLQLTKVFKNGQGNDVVDDNSDSDQLPAGWEQHSDKTGPYFWHVSTGVIQRTRPSSELPSRRGSSTVVVYHDDEEINQSELIVSPTNGNSDCDEDDYYESGAALTADDSSETTFVVYPMGCCEFDETQLMSATSSKAIQKCILRLSNQPQNIGSSSGSSSSSCCWGLSQSEPILMRLFDDHIQFKELKTQILLRSQPIQTIKTWAVDDNNNFAFVIEDRPSSSYQNTTSSQDERLYYESEVDYALLSEPILMCYVFRSVDEDDMMSCRVAAKLNEEINRYKEQMINRMTKSTRLQQMIEVRPARGGENLAGSEDDGEDLDNDDDDDDDLEASNELTMNVKYIGKLPVPRPTGIDVLNVAIDKCLAEATLQANLATTEAACQTMDSSSSSSTTPNGQTTKNLSPLLEAKIHVSPSSVIVENVTTGEIIVECRIRYLTFMGISKRDIRWCGFIMQNATNKSFVAHCFECHPTAGHVCEAIQLSCSRMYEKIVKNSNHNSPDTISIIPTGSKIRNTLAKTLSRIKLNPLLR